MVFFLETQDIKIASIVGVRPNFVKLAALSRLLDDVCEHVIIHTGQHYDYELSKAFFKCLSLPVPDHNLSVGSGSRCWQLGEMLKRLGEALTHEKPDVVIVYGDANSTLAGALASVKLGFKTAHLEAGYRTFDRNMPEEVNRVLTDAISDLLFAPTETAVANLAREGVAGDVHLTGDVMVDVLLDYREVAERESSIIEELGVDDYVLITVHRQKNTDNRERLTRIVEALNELKEYTFVFPMHPRTKKQLQSFNLHGKVMEMQNIVVTSPLNYLDFVKLEMHASKIVTDSGGVQKEAYVLGVPCITLLRKLGLVETVEEGWNMPVDANYNEILAAVRGFAPKSSDRRDSLGDGNASERIFNVLLQAHAIKHLSSKI